MMSLKILTSLRVITTITFVSVLVSSCGTSESPPKPKVVKEIVENNDTK